jgi:hypothetical protein
LVSYVYPCYIGGLKNPMDPYKFVG